MAQNEALAAQSGSGTKQVATLLEEKTSLAELNRLLEKQMSGSQGEVQKLGTVDGAAIDLSADARPGKRQTVCRGPYRFPRGQAPGARIRHRRSRLGPHTGAGRDGVQPPLQNRNPRRGLRGGGAGGGGRRLRLSRAGGGGSTGQGGGADDEAAGILAVERGRAGL